MNRLVPQDKKFGQGEPAYSSTVHSEKLAGEGSVAVAVGIPVSVFVSVAVVVGLIGFGATIHTGCETCAFPYAVFLRYQIY